jgi:hypothetical protein
MSVLDWLPPTRVLNLTLIHFQASELWRSAATGSAAAAPRPNLPRR